MLFASWKSPLNDLYILGKLNEKIDNKRTQVRTDEVRRASKAQSLKRLNPKSRETKITDTVRRIRNILQVKI